MNNEDTKLHEAVEFKHLHKNIHTSSYLSLKLTETTKRKPFFSFSHRYFWPFCPSRKTRVFPITEYGHTRS